jgi:hypothetical protein
VRNVGRRVAKLSAVLVAVGERESPEGPEVLRWGVRVPSRGTPADRLVVVVKPW